VAYDYNGDLLALELPLQQCGIQCTSSALNIVENNVQPSDKATIRAWEDMLSNYNMTFRAVLGRAKL
jgi:hypothetical protein